MTRTPAAVERDAAGSHQLRRHVVLAQRRHGVHGGARAAARRQAREGGVGLVLTFGNIFDEGFLYYNAVCKRPGV